MKAYLINVAERVGSTFAATLLGFLVIGGATIATVNWPVALEVAATAALVSLLKAIVARFTTGTSSLVLSTIEGVPNRARRHLSSADGNPSVPQHLNGA